MDYTLLTWCLYGIRETMTTGCRCCKKSNLEIVDMGNMCR